MNGIAHRAPISTPKPDIAFGYQPQAIFRITERATDEDVHKLLKLRDLYIVNEEGLLLPYLLVEVKTACKDMEIATNQLLGGTSITVNLCDGAIENDNAVFGVTMHNEFAKIFVTWKNGEKHFMKEFEAFTFLHFDQYFLFQKMMFNIHKWAATDRLETARNRFTV
ncbi:uncharacterized protein F4807DRAFT_459907 [Annulohypoxylon truncatum]|uniref:uncharacterized protein n=1 Tax=Annulohypoxylon truncatum TaxID=327061 RepID=UPI002008AFBD|nr:uncharacterized protein F4807DRAFT_459907 [Annulohypoxylon truncatum]KAI1210072.1 hypothetical protein F4807DRAFT_459907 [Annulohypoxylon truncatum]